MPNRTTPEFWKDDVALNSLTRDAELLFRKIQHICDDDHRFPIIPSPQEPTSLWASLYYLRRGIRVTDVARWLDEIQKAGAIAIRDSERGWYGQVAERLRYRAEDYAKGAPRHGPRLEKPAEQPLLPLGPVSMVRPVPMKPQKSKPNDYEYGNDNDPDSAKTRVSEIGDRRSEIVVESKNRALSSGGESKRFAREPEVLLSTPLGKRWGRFLGMAQVVKEAGQSGAEWGRILAEEAQELADALECGERVIGELPTGVARAKYLTKRLGERRGRGDRRSEMGDRASGGGAA